MSRKPPTTQLAPQLRLASAAHLRFMIETSRVGDVQPGPKKDSLALFPCRQAYVASRVSGSYAASC